MASKKIYIVLLIIIAIFFAVMFLTFGVENIKQDNNCLIDIKVFVPNVINLETAVINVHEFKHAYDLWKLIH